MGQLTGFRTATILTIEGRARELVWGWHQPYDTDVCSVCEQLTHMSYVFLAVRGLTSSNSNNDSSRFDACCGCCSSLYTFRKCNDSITDDVHWIEQSPITLTNTKRNQFVVSRINARASADSIPYLQKQSSTTRLDMGGGGGGDTADGRQHWNLSGRRLAHIFCILGYITYGSSRRHTPSSVWSRSFGFQKHGSTSHCFDSCRWRVVALSSVRRTYVATAILENPHITFARGIRPKHCGTAESQAVRRHRQFRRACAGRTPKQRTRKKTRRAVLPLFPSTVSELVW